MLKRLLEVIFSIVLLLLLSPIFLLLILLIRFTLGSPVFFKQDRIGEHEKIFIIYKFRTMIEAHDENDALLPDKKRLTSVGNFLRKYSLDELPQLFNIVRGEMSFIGPRPLLAEYKHLFNEKQRRRHLIKPGITGFAQVHGRNALSWEKKFDYDVWYIDHRTFWLDVWIVFLTIKRVCSANNISSKSNETMEKFTRT